MEAVPDPASPGKAGAEMVLLRAVDPEGELAVGRGHRVVQFHHRLDALTCVEGRPQASVLQEIVSPVVAVRVAGPVLAVDVVVEATRGGPGLGGGDEPS